MADVIKAQGIVSYMNSRPAGKGTVHSFRLVNDEAWYNCGFKKPDFQKGDEVRFEYTVGNYGPDVDMDSIKSRPSQAPQSHQGGSASKYSGGKKKSYGGGGAKDDYWQKKDERDINITQPLIMYQAATQVAKDISIAALQAGILPTAGTKKADKWESFLDIVREVRGEVFGDYMRAYKDLQDGKSITDDDAEAEPAPIEKEATPEPASAPAEAPADDGWSDLEDDEWK